jgi:hypothetical protein
MRLLHSFSFFTRSFLLHSLSITTLLYLSSPTSYIQHTEGTADHPPSQPSDPNNFNGSNQSALVKIWTLSGTCDGLPTVAVSAIYDGLTCIPVSAGGIKVLCEIDGYPATNWALQFFADLNGGQCLQTPYMSITGTNTYCYQYNINGRTISAFVDCGGGVQSQLQDPATFQTAGDQLLPSGGGGTGAEGKSATIKKTVNATSYTTTSNSTAITTTGATVTIGQPLQNMRPATSTATSTKMISLASSIALPLLLAMLI